MAVANVAIFTDNPRKDNEKFKGFALFTLRCLDIWKHTVKLLSRVYTEPLLEIIKSMWSCFNDNDTDNETVFIAKWHTVHVQMTYVKNRSSRTDIHEIYKTWQRGLEAIVAYVPQYQLCRADCFGSAEQKQCRVLEVFQYKDTYFHAHVYPHIYLIWHTYAYTYTCLHIYTQRKHHYRWRFHALSIAESCNKVIVWKQEQYLDVFLEWTNCTFRLNSVKNIIPDTSTTIT